MANGLPDPPEGVGVITDRFKDIRDKAAKEGKSFNEGATFSSREGGTLDATPTPEEISAIFAGGGSVTSSDDAFNEKIQVIRERVELQQEKENDPNLVNFEGKFIHKDLAEFAEESRAAVGNFDVDELDIIKDQFGFQSDEAAAGFLTRGLGLRDNRGLPNVPSLLDARFGPAGAVGADTFSEGSLLREDVDTAGVPLVTVDQIDAAGGPQVILDAAETPEEQAEVMQEIADVLAEEANYL